ncbi:reverse transcriptase family protein [Vibrio vulnificus]|uniref:reverse transcriptase family protein n=1 Tax=Vibrio vulnificus TaxID=672 RepID=UPI0019311CE4|nr:reverse transcriptase family protein [Vibrio vulnificus]
MSSEYIRWLDYLRSNGVQNKQARILAEYAHNLVKSNLPVIFEIEHFSKLLGIELSLLSRMSGASSLFYRGFSIPKKRKGVRKIDSPYPKLAYVQLWIKSNILERLPISDNAYAYTKGRSHIQNARAHIGAKELLKLDMRDFFNRISRLQVEQVFLKCGYSDNVASVLSNLCSYNGVLPQGASTSPILSNIVLKELDDVIQHVAEKYSLIYTRYADDITLSGNSISKNVCNEVMQYIEEFGLPVNEEKVHLLKQNDKKIVTGLIVTDSSLRVSKQMRRAYRQESYYLIKNGETQFDGSTKPLKPLYLDEVIGKGSYILQVEPENDYVRNTLRDLSKLKSRLFSNV